MYSDLEKKIPIHRALWYVLLSVVVFWGSLFVAWIVHQSTLKTRQKDSRFDVVAIVQSCAQKEGLRTWQLAEILELSRDEPVNLYAFDPSLACQRLLSCPVIKSAHCRRQRPGIVHVDYQVREPFALVSDFHNVAIDNEGYLFPLQPYFTPKKLPEIYLGLAHVAYGQKLDTEEAKLAFSIFQYVESHFSKVSRLVSLDTHNAFAPSKGASEVILAIQERPDAPIRYLRLDAKEYEKSLDAYLALKNTFDALTQEKQCYSIDLRCPNIALVKAY